MRSSRQKLAGILAACALLGGLAACDAHPGKAAIVNNTAVSESEVDAFITSYGKLLHTAPDAVDRRAVIQAIVLSQVVEPVWKKYKLTVSPEDFKIFIKGDKLPKDLDPYFKEFLEYSLLQQKAATSPDSEAIKADINVALQDAKISVNPRYGVWDSHNPFMPPSYIVSEGKIKK